MHEPPADSAAGAQAPAGGFSPALEAALTAAAPTDFLPGLEDLDAGAGLLEIHKPEAAKRYTAERIQADTARRDGIISALAEGIGVHRIALAYRVSVHTVIALRDRSPHLVATEKKRLAKLARGVAALCLERYADAVALGSVKADTLPIGFGILIQRAAELDGDPSMIVEHRHEQRVTPENFDAYIRTLARAEPVPAEENGAKKGPAGDGSAAIGAGQALELQDPSARGAQVLRDDRQSTAPERETGDLLQDPLQEPAGSAGSSDAADPARAGLESEARAQGGGGGRVSAGAPRERLERPHKIF